MGWVLVAAPAMLAVVVARWLATGRWRRPDDEPNRHVRVWLLPVAVAVAALLASPFFAGRPLPVTITYAAALVWGATLVVIDLEVRRLPDRLTLPAYAVAAAALLACSLVTDDLPALWRASACAGAAIAVFLVIALVSPGGEGLGLGDVKLAGVLGLLLGWIGWGNAVMGLLGSFVLGGLVAAVLLLVRRLDRRSHLSFGPDMVISAYLWCVLPPLT